MSKGKKPLPGDWYCPGCNDLQFARNTSCRQCGTPKPASGGMGGCAGKGNGARMGGGYGEMYYAPVDFGGYGSMKGGCFGAPMMACGGGSERLGDWYCPSCGDLQFAKNQQCRQCGTPRPAVGGVGMGGGMASYGACGAFSGSIPMMAVGPASGAVERPGDWYCTACGDLQFAKNANCRKCGEPKDDGRGGYSNGRGYKGGGGGGGDTPKGGKPGDWICGNCGDLQFARNTSCRKCGAAPPSNGGVPYREENYSGGRGAEKMRPGDWSCPNCGDHVFARNDACRKCGTAKPDLEEEEHAFEPREEMPSSGGKGRNKGKQMKPGDWICPSCGDLQFARNSECRMCRAPKPDEEGGVGSRSRSRSPR